MIHTEVRIAWKSLREHKIEINNFKKKKGIKSRNPIERKDKDKKYCKVRGHCHYAGEYTSAAYSICDLLA